MTKYSDDEFHTALHDFISDLENYEVKFLEIPCDEDKDKIKSIVAHFENQGFEVFPRIVGSGGNECSIHIRKKKI